MRGSQGGFTPGGFFDSSRRIFRRIFLADFSFAKNPPQNPPQNPPLRGEFLFQKSPGLEAPEIHRPPPPRESKSKSCAFGSGTVTFQGGSFQEKTPGLIGPRNLRILIGRIAVGWPCMECHVPCHISIHWVWDSVKQSEGWGRNTALIARSPTRHSIFFLKMFITNCLCWFGSPTWCTSFHKRIATSIAEHHCTQCLVNFTLSSLRFHTLQTRTLSSFALSNARNCRVLAHPRLASSGPRLASSQAI